VPDPLSSPAPAPSTCPVHPGQQAPLTCPRCGSFGCDRCWTKLGLCQACTERHIADLPPTRRWARFASGALIALATEAVVLQIVVVLTSPMRAGPPERLLGHPIFAALIVLLSILPILLAAVAIGFLGWVHRLTVVARGRGARLEITPGWAVGWYFIPLANLVLPWKHLREVARSLPAARLPPIDAWWAALVGVLVLTAAGSFEPFQFRGLGHVETLLGVVAAALAVRVIGMFERALAPRADADVPPPAP
jgi:hypothetical protein